MPDEGPPSIGDTEATLITCVACAGHWDVVTIVDHREPHHDICIHCTYGCMSAGQLATYKKWYSERASR